MMSFTVSFTIFFVIVQLISISEQACSIYENGLSENDKRTIVNFHNSLRDKIKRGEVPGQPKGVNLKTIQWDDCLAKAAQNLANKCQFEHSTVQCSPWRWVGQNIYKSMSTGYSKGSDWKGAIQAWFDEYKQYRFGTQSPGTGHYTQVVWADTDRVGCGYTFYKGGWPYEKIYFCNYGPGGNIVGQNPYRTG